MHVCVCLPVSTGCWLRCHVSWHLPKIPVPLRASCFSTWSFPPWHRLAFSPTGVCSQTCPTLHCYYRHVLYIHAYHCVFSCRQSELLVTLNRQLERCLRNSRCIDTESLCVISGEKVTLLMMM